MQEQISLLIVDDELDFLDTICERMEMRGFDVTKASNGQLALDAAKTKKYDIALLDLKMPGLNGQEVLEILKREHDYLQVIIITAHGSVDAAFETSKLGAFDFLTKPIDFDKLILSIKSAYESRIMKKFNYSQEDLYEKFKSVSDVPLYGEPLDIILELKKLDDEKK